MRSYPYLRPTVGFESHSIGPFTVIPVSIHIIVKNRNVTLTGVVGNEMDKTLGTFSVTNKLRVER